MESLGQTVPSGAVDKMVRLLAELERWGRRVNLTAIRDPAEMVSAHLLDSLSVRPYLEGARIADVGTGAGFPGLPLALAEPQRTFVLIDSNGKKIRFVNHVVRTLGVDNVEALKVRCEDYAPGEGFDTVLARALAATPQILELAGHLVGGGGIMLAQKGKHPAEELEQLPATWKYTVKELTVPGMEKRSRHVVILKRADGR